MTLNVEPCPVGPIWLMALPSEHCHTGGVFTVAKLKKKSDRQNLTLMTLNVEPCQLGPIWLMILPSCIVTLVACLWQPN